MPSLSAQSTAVLDERCQVLVHLLAHRPQLQVLPSIDFADFRPNSSDALGQDVEVSLADEDRVVRPRLVRVDIDDRVQNRHKDLGVGRRGNLRDEPSTDDLPFSIVISQDSSGD